MQSIETEAKTVQEAIDLACVQLNTTEDNLNIEIIQNPSTKIFSFFSNKKAKIKATLTGSAAVLPSDGLLDRLKQTLEKIVRQIDAAAHIEVDTAGDEPVFNIVGDGSGIFIGKKGNTLSAIQFVLNKIRLNQCADLPHVIVDSESYRSRHRSSIVQLAKRLAEKAKKRSGPVSTNPLNPSDRRIVHMELKTHEDLVTWSKGDGTLKRVIIAPKKNSN